MPLRAMAPTAHFDCCASTGFLPGSRPCLPNLRDEQDSRYLVCQARGRSGCCRTSSIVSLLNRNRKISHTNRHLFVTIVEHFSISQRWQDRRTEVRVAADYPDSKPDASSIFGDLGYHPLEDIPSFEKKKHIEQADRRLTDAEVARTLAEVNQSAIIYAPVEQDVDHVLGTEVRYIIDEHGDFYFQIDDDSEFLSTLNNAQYLNIAIGYKNIGDWMLEHEVNDDNAQDDSEDSDDSNSHDEEEEEEGETWVVVAAEDAEFVLEAVDDGPSEPIGDWSGLDTLQFVHPLDFAGALAEAAVANYQEKIERPSKTLKMVGELCHLNDDEEEYVQRLFHDKFRDEDEDDEEIEEGVKHDDDTHADGSDDVVLLAKDVTGSSKGGEDEQIAEAAEYSDGTTTFYKLEIQQIHVVSGLGAQINVDKTEFQSAKPDILAQFSSVIIERLNSCGKSLEDTLKTLCLQKKGLEVEEVVLLEIDSLGMDLRVHCGREVQTIRIPFNQRATSVEHAEQLLNQLLNPRIQHRARRKRRPWSQGKAS